MRAPPRYDRAAREGEVLWLARRWFSWPKVSCALVLCAGVGYLTLVAWARFDEIAMIAILPTIVFGLLGYFTLGLLCNRTIVRVDPQQAVVRHVPLPFPGNVAFAIPDVQSFGVVTESSSRGGPRNFIRTGSRQTHHVVASMFDGSRRWVVTMIGIEGDAEWLAGRLDRYLRDLRE